MRDWRLLWLAAVAAGAAPARPAALRDDAADRGADPRPVRHEPRPDGRLHAADLVRPCRGLRPRRLCVRLPAAAHRACRCRSRCSLAALFSGVVAIGVGLGVHAGDRRLVLHADAGLRATALRGGVQMDQRHRRVRRAGGHPAQSRARSASPCFTSKAGFYYLVLACLVGGVRLLPLAGALAVRRGAARHPRERGEDPVARLQHAPLQDRGRGDLLRVWAAWPARCTRRSPASPTPNCCSGCSRARC